MTKLASVTDFIGPPTKGNDFTSTDFLNQNDPETRKVLATKLSSAYGVSSANDQVFKREEGKHQKKTKMTYKTTLKRPLTKEEKCPFKYESSLGSGLHGPILDGFLD
jgi:hypothetical protein